MSARLRKLTGALLLLGLLAAGAGAYLTRPIVIGVSLSPDTALGHESLLALRHYVARRPQIGLRPVHLEVRTPLLERESQEQAYRELAASKASIVIGAALSKAGLIQAEQAQATGLPCFSVSASTAALRGRDDGFFRLVVDTDAAGALAATFLAPDHRRVAILAGASNRAYTEAFAQSVSKSLPGSKVFSLADDERARVEVKAYQPDAVFLVVSPATLLRWVKTLRELIRPDLPIFSSDWGLFAVTLYSGADLEGVGFVTQNGSPIEPYAAWLREFERSFDHVAAHTSAYCVSIMDIVYRGLEEVGDDRARLRAWLATPRVYDYAYGRVALDAAGDATRAHHYLFTVHEGHLKLSAKREVAAFRDE